MTMIMMFMMMMVMMLHEGEVHSAVLLQVLLGIDTCGTSCDCCEDEGPCCCDMLWWIGWMGFWVKFGGGPPGAANFSQLLQNLKHLVLQMLPGVHAEDMQNSWCMPVCWAGVKCLVFRCASVGLWCGCGLAQCEFVKMFQSVDAIGWPGHGFAYHEKTLCQCVSIGVWHVGCSLCGFVHDEDVLNC